MDGKLALFGFIVTILLNFTSTENNDNICEGKKHGALLPHPEDCTKFYQCANDEPHEMNCPNGLHFNPKLKVCDWPESANCQMVQSSMYYYFPIQDESFVNEKEMNKNGNDEMEMQNFKDYPDSSHIS